MSVHTIALYLFADTNCEITSNYAGTANFFEAEECTPFLGYDLSSPQSVLTAICDPFDAPGGYNQSFLRLHRRKCTSQDEYGLFNGVCYRFDGNYNWPLRRLISNWYDNTFLDTYYNTTPRSLLVTGCYQDYMCAIPDVTADPSYVPTSVPTGPTSVPMPTGPTSVPMPTGPTSVPMPTGPTSVPMPTVVPTLSPTPTSSSDSSSSSDEEPNPTGVPPEPTFAPTATPTPEPPVGTPVQTKPPVTSADFSFAIALQGDGFAAFFDPITGESKFSVFTTFVEDDVKRHLNLILRGTFVKNITATSITLIPPEQFRSGLMINISSELDVSESSNTEADRAKGIQYIDDLNTILNHPTAENTSSFSLWPFVSELYTIANGDGVPLFSVSRVGVSVNTLPLRTFSTRMEFVMDGNFSLLFNSNGTLELPLFRSAIRRDVEKLMSTRAVEKSQGAIDDTTAASAAQTGRRLISEPRVTTERLNSPCSLDIMGDASEVVLPATILTRLNMCQVLAINRTGSLNPNAPNRTDWIPEGGAIIFFPLVNQTTTNPINFGTDVWHPRRFVIVDLIPFSETYRQFTYVAFLMQGGGGEVYYYYLGRERVCFEAHYESNRWLEVACREAEFFQVACDSMVHGIPPSVSLTHPTNRRQSESGGDEAEQAQGIRNSEEPLYVPYQTLFLDGNVRGNATYCSFNVTVESESQESREFLRGQVVQHNLSSQDFFQESQETYVSLHRIQQGGSGATGGIPPGNIPQVPLVPGSSNNFSSITIPVGGGGIGPSSTTEARATGEEVLPESSSPAVIEYFKTLPLRFLRLSYASFNEDLPVSQFYLALEGDWTSIFPVSSSDATTSSTSQAQLLMLQLEEALILDIADVLFGPQRSSTTTITHSQSTLDRLRLDALAPGPRSRNLNINTSITSTTASAKEALDIRLAQFALNPTSLTLSRVNQIYTSTNNNNNGNGFIVSMTIAPSSVTTQAPEGAVITPTSPTTTTDIPGNSPSESPSGGGSSFPIIAPIIGGAAAVIIAIVVSVCVYWRCCRNRGAGIKEEPSTANLQAAHASSQSTASSQSSTLPYGTNFPPDDVRYGASRRAQGLYTPPISGDSDVYEIVQHNGESSYFV